METMKTQIRTNRLLEILNSFKDRNECLTIAQAGQELGIKPDQARYILDKMYLEKKICRTSEKNTQCHFYAYRPLNYKELGVKNEKKQEAEPAAKPAVKPAENPVVKPAEVKVTPVGEKEFFSIDIALRLKRGEMFYVVTDEGTVSVNKTTSLTLDMILGNWISIGVPKICPFCKGEAVVTSFSANGKTLHVVQCTHCKAAGPPKNSNTEAIKAWNGE